MASIATATSTLMLMISDSSLASLFDDSADPNQYSIDTKSSLDPEPSERVLESEVHDVRVLRSGHITPI
jgi:hypothetical protein